MSDNSFDERTGAFVELHRHIRCVEDERAQDALIIQLLHPPRPYIVSFVNAHAANLSWKSPRMLDCLLRSDVLLRDGIGMELSLFTLGYPYGLNMNGTDFIPRLARAYAGRRAAVFGTRQPWLHNAQRKITDMGLDVVACHDGYSPPEAYSDLALDSEPDLIILGMGMPKQEHVAVRLRDQLSHSALIVNGGAILDFMGGKVARAPELMRRSGTEWVYRLCMEPTRLAPRYLVGIPTFLTHVARTRLSGVPPADHDSSPE